MRSIDQQLHLLSDSEVSDLVAQRQSELGGTDPAIWNEALLHHAWELFHGLNLLEEYLEAAPVLHQIGVRLENLVDQPPFSESILDQFYEWSVLAIRMTTESKEEFVCYPAYQKLTKVVSEGPVHQHYRLLEIRLMLMRHYEYWLEKGGEEERLYEDEVEFLKGAGEGFEKAYEEIVEDAENREDFDACVPLYRLAAQYYFIVDQPNDGIACLKAALEDIDKTTDFIPAYRADLLLEIGKKFLEFNKKNVALRYFEEAIDIFKSGGDAFDVQAAQVEAWINIAGS